MSSLNKVILIGNLCADPELKQTPNGISVCNFSIGVTRRYKNAEGRYDSDFFNIVTWRQTAKFVTKYFNKGKSICVVGSLQQRSWTDQQQQKRYTVEVLADEVSFVDKAESGQVSRECQANEANATFANQTSANTSIANNYGNPPPETHFTDLNSDDDLPF